MQRLPHQKLNVNNDIKISLYGYMVMNFIKLRIDA